MSNFPEESRATYLGAHAILDIWVESHNIKYLKDAEFLEMIMRESALAAGATILNSKFHSFGIDAGITGMLILSESHISVHTWPEKGFLAFDVFMCGKSDPSIAIKTLISNFSIKKKITNFILRGIESDHLKFLSS